MTVSRRRQLAALRGIVTRMVAAEAAERNRAAEAAAREAAEARRLAYLARLQAELQGVPMPKPLPAHHGRATRDVAHFAKPMFALNLSPPAPRPGAKLYNPQ